MRSVFGFTLACSLFFTISVNAQFTIRNINGSTNVLSDIQMVNASVGYVGGVDGIFKTTNGGDTWTWSPYFVSTLPAGQREKFTYMNEQSLAFLNENVGYVAGWNAEGNLEEIIKTTDGGATWQVQHYFNPDTSPFQPLEKRLRDIKAFDETHAIAVGYRGRILKTQDGTNWSVVPSGTTRDLETVAFYNTSIGLVAGNKEILLTTNGGETFQRYTTSYHFLDAHYLSEQTILATTTTGLIRSTDGGQSWTAIMNGSNLHKISFVNNTLGFITGVGTVLKTTDGGLNFESLTLYYSAFYPISVTAIQARAERELYLTTTRGELYMVKNQDLPFVPESKFSADRTSACDNSGTPINFTNQGRADYQYQWLINDQLVAQTYNFSHTFTQAGNYKVSLVAHNGVMYDTAFQEINVISKLPFTNHFLHTTLPDSIERVSQQGYNRFSIWNLQQNAYYQLFRNGLPISERKQPQFTNIEIQLPDVLVGGTNTYKIVAEIENSCGTTTEEKSFDVVILDIPMRPTNLKVDHDTSTTIRLQWIDNSQQDQYFEVERRVEGTAEFEVIGTATGFNQINFEDPSPKVPHKTYYYRVVAVNASGKSTYSNIAAAFIHGNIIYVNPNATGNNTGASWQHALTSLAKAVDESSLDQEVWVAKGTYVSDGWIAYTKGIYGGFTGTETQRDQRNFHLNKTIITGEKGIPGNLNDNAETVIRVTGILDGFTIRGGKTTGVQLYKGNLYNCTVEGNNYGVGVGGEILTRSKIEKCVIRNNTTGISAGIPLKIGNSFIYNNSAYGITATTDVTAAHCTLYANKLGFVHGNFPTNGENEIEFVNSIIGYRPEDTQIDFWGQRVQYYNSVYKTTSWGIKYHMNYMAGMDNILGTDDDVFYFPEPEFQNGGMAIINPYYFGYLLELTNDYFGQTRIVGDTSDIGPAEFLPETNQIPTLELKSISADGKPTFKWEAIPGASRIWLERRRYEEVIFFPVDGNATEYTDQTAEFLKDYNYSIRLQFADRGTFPSNRIFVYSPTALLQVQTLTSSTCQVSYTYSYTLPAVGHQISRYEGSLNNYDKSLGYIIGSQYSITDTNLKSGTTYYYQVWSTFKPLPNVTHPMMSNIVKIVTPTNAKPVITGQQQASVYQHGQFVIDASYLTVQDDYNFPSGMEIEVLPGNNYTVLNNKVVPDPTFIGSLTVSVRVSDKELKSDPYNFSLSVTGNSKPVIQTQQAARTLQGTSYLFSLNTLTVTDDHNFPSGAILTIGTGASYTLSDKTITPAADFTGNLTIPITVSDGAANSEPFNFTLHVVKIIEGDFMTTSTNIEEGTSIDFNSSFAGVPQNFIWEFEGAIPSSSSDENPKNILYPTAGTFKVQLTLQDDLQNYPIIKEDFITVNLITGTEEQLPLGLRIFPNPANQRFSLTSSAPLLLYSISVLDYTGKEVRNISVTDTNHAYIDLPAGQYMMVIREANKTYYKKIVSY